MKKFIYVCLLVLLGVSFGCEKEAINQENEDLKITEKSDLNKRGFTGDGSNGNNQVYDGTNYNNTPPNGYHWTLLITYSQGVTEFQKREFRVQYQVTGELWYFEQCPNDPQKEIWYFVPASSSIPCQVPWPLNCQRGDTPPQSPPDGFCLIEINQSCND